MALNWIDVNDFSCRTIFLMERFQLRMLMHGDADALGIMLKYHPDLAWYIANRCPECAAWVKELSSCAPDGLEKAQVREAEVAVLAGVEDFVIHTRPELMGSHCPYIYGWEPFRLLELADFTGKRVLDVGSGSGRLAFAAAARAKEVYAVEPVETLREFIRMRAAEEGVCNIRVADGFAHSLPYPDDTFDIVMSGHVVGDDYENELNELARVCKPGGWLIDCPGEEDRALEPDEELRRRGWEEFYYRSRFGGDVYRYRIRNEKK